MKSAPWSRCLVTVLLAGLTATVQAATPSLCTAQEKPVFACTLAPSGKLVSLCAPREARAAKTGLLAYRFGRPGRIELAYVRPYSDFRFVHYSRYQVDRTEVSFDNAGYTYSVFDYDDESEHPPVTQGVAVLRQGDAHGPGTQLRCRGKATAELQTLESRVPCDADNALSLGSCAPQQ